jgi:hypothetical protein
MKIEAIISFKRRDEEKKFKEVRFLQSWLRESLKLTCPLPSFKLCQASIITCHEDIHEYLVSTSDLFPLQNGRITPPTLFREK